MGCGNRLFTIKKLNVINQKTNENGQILLIEVKKVKT